MRLPSIKQIGIINEKIKSFDFKIIEVNYLKTTETFEYVIFSNNTKLTSEVEFDRFCRLISNNHLEEAVYYITDFEKFKKLNKERISKARAIGGRAACLLRKGIPTGKIPWNKGKKMETPSWSKGLTKETDERCNNISKAKMGDKNPMFGRPVSEETREKLSKKLKLAINEGRFTPNIFNSQTRKQILFNNVLFRSSWEVLFYQSFSHMLYEKVRIPYIGEDQKSHTFITDFFDKENNTVYEIKPSKFILKKKVILDKIIEYCTKNNIKFILLDEIELTNLIPEHSVKYEEFNEHTQKLIRGLYEGVKKGRNRKTSICL